MEVRQLPSGEWRPIPKLKNLPEGVSRVSLPRTFASASQSGVDLTAMPSSSEKPNWLRLTGDAVSPNSADRSASARTTAGNPVVMVSSLQRLLLRIQQFGAGAALLRQRSPLDGQSAVTGCVALAIGIAIGNIYAALHRYSEEAYRQQVLRAESAEAELFAARASADSTKLNAGTEPALVRPPREPQPTSNLAQPGARMAEPVQDSSAGRLSSLSGEAERSIIAMADKSAELLADRGIYESRDSLISAALEIYPRSTRAVKVAECFASYVTLRKKGESHFDAAYLPQVIPAISGSF